MKLNLCCGSTHITDCVNIDIEESLKPDMCFDIRKDWPLAKSSVEEIYFFHAIEHIEKKHHRWIFHEIHRVLVDEGKLIVSYPEFSKIAKNWIENNHGMREFFEHTIYGRQVHKSDYHVCAIDSTELAQLLTEEGFKEIISRPEPHDYWNTVTTCYRGVPYISREELLFNEIFAR